MKTLLAAIEMPPAFGGVETYYANLARYWPEELSVIDNSKRELVNPRLPFLKWLPAVFSIARALRDKKPEWIIAGEVLPIGTAVWILSHFFSFKYAVFLHGLDLTNATKGGRKRRLTARILSRANLVLCANSHTGALAQQLVPTGRFEIVNPGVETDAVAVSPTLRTGLKHNYDLSGHFVLVTIARLVKRKGIDMVLRALSEVIKTRPAIRYIIIGNGPEENSIKLLADELNLDAYVTLLTDLDDEKKHAWLDLADAFIMPARDLKGDYEGFGIVYLEANQHGKPVIAGRSGGVGDAVENNVNGIQINEEDPVAIAAAIEKLADDPEYAKKLGEQGRERSKRFGWNQQIEAIYSFLKNA